jgi:hypothetical protein
MAVSVRDSKRFPRESHERWCDLAPNDAWRGSEKATPGCPTRADSLGWNSIHIEHEHERATPSIP